MIAAAPRLYTLPFGLLCLSQMLFASSFTMILPELPSYLSSLGGEDFKGLIIALFTLTAGLSRPFSGKLSDTVGRVPIMIFGTLVCVVCSLLYPLISSVLGFLLLRFFHGLSTGFKPTASTAYVADIAPPARRGEALGILSMSMNMGGALAPAFGSWLAQATSLNTMFMVSSGVALLSIAILVGLRETLSKKEPFHPRLLILSRKEVIEPSALDPAVVTALVYLGYGALLTVIPDQSEYFGLRNKGWFFSIFTLFSLVSRFVSGKMSDRYGRAPVLKIGMFLVAISMALMGAVQSGAGLLIASAALGFAHGVVGPALFAWAIDRSVDERRGRAVGTVYIALEFGIGLGALSSAWLYDNQAQHFDRTFYVLGVFTFCGFLYLFRKGLRGEKSLQIN
ncbi:MAG: MFS transporter [Saprospirales bacterium]|nr:MFS transporter [Saprospirales bacterium]